MRRKSSCRNSSKDPINYICVHPFRNQNRTCGQCEIEQPPVPQGPTNVTFEELGDAKPARAQRDKAP